MTIAVGCLTDGGGMQQKLRTEYATTLYNASTAHAQLTYPFMRYDDRVALKKNTMIAHCARVRGVCMIYHVGLNETLLVWSPT